MTQPIQLVEQLALTREAGRFKGSCRRRLSRCRQILEAILEAGGRRRADNTLRPLNDLMVDLGELHRAANLMRSVHPRREIREAAEESEQEISRFATEVGLNRPLYEAVRACEPGNLAPLACRFRERLLRDFHRSGVDREDAVRDEVRRLKNELVALSQEFSRNILTDVRSIRLEGAGELVGLPEDYVRAHPPAADGTITITTDYPDYNPFMAYARSSRRREELYRAFRRRAYPENARVLKAILERRHHLATLLGYRHWADYITENKMIKSAAEVQRFIERVSDLAGERSAREYEELLRRKRRDHPAAREVHDWEKGYYEEVLRSERFQVDSRDLRPYFPYPAVRDGVLAVAAELFGVEFRRAAGAPVWHRDVEALDVLEDGRTVGRIYLDMHPREGKFKHAAMFPLVPGIRGRCMPAAALVCNFPNPRTAPEAALLEHDDVVTFFHELGHLVHHLLARDHEWVEFSGTATEWDFVEVPSQLLEEWAWDPVVLGRFAHHYRSGAAIPEGVVESLRQARDFGQGLYVRQQMVYASLSLKCHNTDPEPLAIEDLLEELHNRYSRFRFVDDTYFHTSFGHLDNYSALYYTYMWSLVIEKEIFGLFRERGLMDRDLARRYRSSILEPGGSRDGADLVRDFLGREYTFEAFERWLNGE